MNILTFLLTLLFLSLAHQYSNGAQLDDSDDSAEEGEEIVIMRKNRVFMKIYSNSKTKVRGTGPKFLSTKAKEARLKSRGKFVEEIRQKNGGKWEVKVVSNLGLLSDKGLAKLAGTLEGPKEKDKKHICGGQNPFDVEERPLREIEQELMDLEGNGEAGHRGDRVKRDTGGGVQCREYVFDIRNKWPQCAKIISNIRDQSNCGSCWAIAATSALTDRYCIAMAKAGKMLDQDDPVNYNSAADVMACSGAASDGRDACNGGYLSRAWEFLTKTGVVSGHNYSQGGCKPYPFPIMADATEDYYSYAANKCPSSCSNRRYQNGYADDKYKALNYNYLYSTGWEQVMKDEIFQNGTISVSMMVYSDFENYGGGIYTHAAGVERGGHAVRLIGYGNITCSDGSSQKYWLGANSWNTDWGTNGVFKIARGTDECQIETRGIAFGTPTVYD